MNVAFIPVRGGSKSIPLKNIKSICGKPLVYWVVKAACECRYIDHVFVSTDSNEIREVMEKIIRAMDKHEFDKVSVVNRSAESATDTASTEFAMLEFAGQWDFQNIALIQATSPLLTGDDLNRGFEVFQQPETDSVLSVVCQKRFNWSVDSSGNAMALNYNVFNRPRRQEFKGYFVENGAFYITSKQRLLESKNRVSGQIKLVEMSEDTFFEIDEPSDWTIIEALMRQKYGNCNIDIPEIKMFLTDCDGCLTDGGMYYSENGDELKKFNTRDGMAFKLLRERGILIGIVTSEKVKLNERRAKKMKLDILEMGCEDKLAVVDKLCRHYNIALENVAYIGDDINDLTVMKAVGLACAPADAVSDIKEVAKYVTSARGGEGVIREVVNKILRMNRVDEKD